MGDIVDFTEETMDESTENAIGESTEKYIGYSAEESNETGKMISTFFFILCWAQIHIKSILGANSADIYVFKDVSPPSLSLWLLPGDPTPIWMTCLFA